MDPNFQFYETRIRNSALRLGHEVLYEGGKTKKWKKKRGKRKKRAGGEKRANYTACGEIPLAFHLRY